MTNQPSRRAAAQAASRPSLDLRGAVDLSGLAARPPAAGAGAGGASAGGPGGGAGGAAPAGSFVIDATEATFAEAVMQRSTVVPVVLDFWAEWCEPCKQLSPVLESLAAEFAGQFLLAKIDVDANQQLAAAFGVQGIPAVFAVVRGQPVPLFQGAQPEAQVRAVLGELLRVAAANGVTGRLDPAEFGAVDAGQEPGDDAAEEVLPPLHQAAYDAIERDDLPAAVEAYEQALREQPGDELARAGLAQVRLLQRTADADLGKARAAAAADPADVPAALLVADLDMLGGHVDDAFGRLIDLVRATSGEERDAVRQRLLELFTLVPADDPRLAKARLALANALF